MAKPSLLRFRNFDSDYAGLQFKIYGYIVMHIIQLLALVIVFFCFIYLKVASQNYIKYILYVFILMHYYLKNGVWRWVYYVWSWGNWSPFTSYQFIWPTDIFMTNLTFSWQITDWLKLRPRFPILNFTWGQRLIWQAIV